VGLDKGQLGHYAVGQLLQQRHLIRLPQVRPVVERAERPQHGAVGADERDAQVGYDAQLPDRQVVGEPRVLPRIADHYRRAVDDDILAERVGQRGLLGAGPRLGEAAAAGEELPVDVDERNQAHGNVQQPGGALGEPVQPGVPRPVEEIERAEGAQADGVAQRLRYVGIIHTGARLWACMAFAVPRSRRMRRW